MVFKALCIVAYPILYNIKKDIHGIIMRFLELREREVINSNDCKRLGYVADIEFNCCTGQIEAIIVPGPGKLFACLGSSTEYYIPFCKVIRVGPDIILVDIDECQCRNAYD